MSLTWIDKPEVRRRKFPLRGLPERGSRLQTQIICLWCVLRSGPVPEVSASAARGLISVGPGQPRFISSERDEARPAGSGLRVYTRRPHRPHHGLPDLRHRGHHRPHRADLFRRTAGTLKKKKKKASWSLSTDILNILLQIRNLSGYRCISRITSMYVTHLHSK